jgi:malonyl-CoA/methylmalonyl-CoA synthetase
VQRQEEPVTVFMGVPTMYSHLLSRYDDMAPAQRAAAAEAARKVR